MRGSAIGILCWLFTANVVACSCLLLPYEIDAEDIANFKFERSGVVFVGRVDSIVQIDEHVSEARITVLQSFKGINEKIITMRQNTCPSLLIKRMAEVLIYADKNSDGILKSPKACWESMVGTKETEREIGLLNKIRNI